VGLEGFDVARNFSCNRRNLSRESFGVLVAATCSFSSLFACVPRGSAMLE
jgi:hypothetical protein